MLEGALSGGMLGPPEDDFPENEEYEEYGEFEDDEDELDEDEFGDDEDPLVARDSDQFVGPHTMMRTSSKGEQALFVGFTLERWLRNCPDGPLQLGPNAGDAIASLVCCWSATVTHALARQPLTLAELDRALDLLDYETVEEHVAAMERTGQVEAQPGDGETRYAVTDWLREGIAPLGAAARLERHYQEEGTAPPDILDVEAAFQLTLPLLKLPTELSGSCRLGVQIPGGPPLLAGATAQVEGGRVVSSSSLLDDNPATWVTGSPVDWLDSLVDPSSTRLKAAGNLNLVHGLLYGLHEKLFGVPVQ
jgi:DNA-binding transcriptional ArsR family regulator